MISFGSRVGTGSPDGIPDWRLDNLLALQSRDFMCNQPLNL